MRDVQSSQRRRRLRLIKTIEEQSSQRFRTAATALMIASDAESARLDADALRRKLSGECRARSSTRLRIEHPGAEPMFIVMDRPYLLIGSDPRCDVRLNHEDVALRHSLLLWIDGQLFCCHIGPRTSLFPDRHSTANGRWVNDHPIDIGPYALSVDQPVSNIPDESPLDRSSQLATEYPLLALQFDGVEQSNNVWPINRKLTIVGRSSHCKLRLNHKSIALAQACLLRTSHGCWLIDLVDDGTTGVNGRPIQVHSVDIGDTLHLGAFRVDVVTVAVPPSVPISRSPISTTSRVANETLPPIRMDRPVKEHSQNARLFVDEAPDQSLPPQLVAVSAIALPERCVDENTCAPSTSRFAPEPISAIRTAEIPSPPQAVDSSDGNPTVTSCPVPASETPVEPTGSIVTSQALLGNEVMPPVMEFSDSSPMATTDKDQLIAQFINQQLNELAALKKKLDALKETYDSAAGQLISKKMRETLEKPVEETLKCHDFLQESLTHFQQLIEGQSV